MSKELFFQKGNNKRYLSADANTWGAATATQYKFNQDYAASTFNSSNPTQPLTKIFKNGDTIMGVLIKGDSTPNGFVAPRPDVIQTTFDGKAPDFNMVGQAWFSIPINYLNSAAVNTPVASAVADIKKLFNLNKINPNNGGELNIGIAPVMQPSTNKMLLAIQEQQEAQAAAQTPTQKYITQNDVTVFSPDKTKPAVNNQPVMNVVKTLPAGSVFDVVRVEQDVNAGTWLILTKNPPTAIKLIPTITLYNGTSQVNAPTPLSLLTPTNMFIAAAVVIGIFIIIK